MLQTFKNKIQRGFGDSAKSYDLCSGLHRKIADKLLAEIMGRDAINGVSTPTAILDVGCGTGYLTAQAQEHFPNSKIVGLDFAQEMLKIAALKYEGISWVLADGNNLSFIDGCFDMVVSNLAYQWARNMSRAFREARRVLSSEGVFACTLFGYKTCQELFQSLDEAKVGTFQFTRLPDEAQVRKALISSGFKNPQVDTEQTKIEFKDLFDLITWLKSLGANHLPREGYVGRETISRAAAIYAKHFAFHNGVAATFEVIRVYAKK